MRKFSISNLRNANPYVCKPLTLFLSDVRAFSQLVNWFHAFQMLYMCIYYSRYSSFRFHTTQRHNFVLCSNFIAAAHIPFVDRVQLCSASVPKLCENPPESLLKVLHMHKCICIFPFFQEIQLNIEVYEITCTHYFLIKCSEKLLYYIRQIHNF